MFDRLCQDLVRRADLLGISKDNAQLPLLFIAPEGNLIPAGGASKVCFVFSHGDETGIRNLSPTTVATLVQNYTVCILCCCNADQVPLVRQLREHADFGVIGAVPGVAHHEGTRGSFFDLFLPLLARSRWDGDSKDEIIKACMAIDEASQELRNAQEDFDHKVIEVMFSPPRMSRTQPSQELLEELERPDADPAFVAWMKRQLHIDESDDEFEEGENSQ